MYTMLPFNHMSRTFDDLFDQMERSMFPTQQSGRLPAFRTDIKDEGDHYLLEADLPGFQKEDIDLHVQDGVLTITAKHDETRENKDESGKYVCRERRTGSYARSFDVSGIREDGIGASYENGVLKLALPKQGEQAPVSRKIAIQ